MRLAVLASAVLFSACTSSAEAPVDVVPEPPAPVPVAPADRPAPVLSASFEAASAACNDWAASGGATAIRSVPARTGDYACKLCGDGPDGALSLTRRTAPLAAGRYVLSAYLRRRQGLPGPEAAQVVLGEAASPLVALPDDGYAFASVAVDVEEGASVDVKIAAIAAASECFLVDDVLVTRE